MSQEELKKIIAQGETLTVEFKSDRERLNDTELLDTVVCLANAQGGVLLVGVEDDGQVTGLHRKHRTRPQLLAAFIASRTVPPLSVEVTFERIKSNGREHLVACLQIPAASQPIATSDGRLLVRYLDPRGEPGCRPLYPHELAGWHANRGKVDVSAQPIAGATWEDLDIVEFARLRRMVEEYRGDTTLLDLSNSELARALGLVASNGNGLTPTVAGLLLVGQESALRTYIPTHEVAFQVLRDSDVLVNEFYRWPLLRIAERIFQAFEIRNEESELNIGLFRVGVPAYDPRSFREAVNNALIHRDYHDLGAVHVQLHGSHIAISNPGGFVKGIRPDNLLVVNPRPRNPRLADCFKRIGLVERIGRGVGIIYKGQLRNGHPPPSYELSSEATVHIELYGGSANLNLVELIINEEKRQEHSLDVSTLLILNYIHREREIEISQVPDLIQRSKGQSVGILEGLVETGLLERRGRGQRRTYYFSARTYRELGQPEAYVRTLGFEPLQMEQMILQYVTAHDRITRREVMTLCRVNGNKAGYLLKKLVKRGELQLVGLGRNAFYILPTQN